MKITIDDKVLDNYNLTLDEFLILLLSARKTNLKECTESLINKGFGNKGLLTGDILILSNEIKNMISSILVDSDSRVENKEDEFTELAQELQNIYPTGRKDGTTYTWRGTTAEIAKKLKTLTIKYGYNITKEKAIKATKTYIESFNGNYKYMKLLKYFILKAELDADDNRNVTSELMSYIENEDHIDKNREEWTSTLK